MLFSYNIIICVFYGYFIFIWYLWLIYEFLFNVCYFVLNNYVIELCLGLFVIDVYCFKNVVCVCVWDFEERLV